MELEEHFGCPWYDPFKFFCFFYQKSVFDIDACCIKRDVSDACCIKRDASND